MTILKNIEKASNKKSSGDQIPALSGNLAQLLSFQGFSIFE